MVQFCTACPTNTLIKVVKSTSWVKSWHQLSCLKPVGCAVPNELSFWVLLIHPQKVSLRNVTMGFLHQVLWRAVLFGPDQHHEYLGCDLPLWRVVHRQRLQCWIQCLRSWKPWVKSLLSASSFLDTRDKILPLEGGSEVAAWLSNGAASWSRVRQCFSELPAGLIVIVYWVQLFVFALSLR